MREDEKIQEQMRDIIMGLQEEEFRDLKKREAALWKEINLPWTLGDILRQLTKAELNSIRKNLYIKGLSALKKDDLIEELEILLPGHVYKAFRVFDDERYQAAKSISKSGFALYSALPLEYHKVAYLRGRGLIFPASRSGKKVLTMPLEVMKEFKKIDSPDYRKTISRNTEWIRLTHGLLHYYGVLTVSQLRNMVGNHIGEEADIIPFMDVLFDAIDYYDEAQSDGRYIFSREAHNVQKIVEEQEERAGLDYHPFTKSQLMQASDPEHIDMTPQFVDLLKFIRDNYKIDRDEAKDLAATCADMIASSEGVSSVMKFLEDNLEFPSLDFVRELTGKIVNMSNNTRMWALKGHTPQELSGVDKSVLQPLPAKAGAKVVNINSQKIGRNAPCPCGSGKKYKKCCGMKD